MGAGGGGAPVRRNGQVMDIIVMRVCSHTLIGLGFLFFGLLSIVIAYCASGGVGAGGGGAPVRRNGQVMDIIVMRVCSHTLIGLGFLFFGLESIVIAYEFAHARRL